MAAPKRTKISAMSLHRAFPNSAEPAFCARSDTQKVAFSFAYFSFGEAKEK